MGLRFNRIKIYFQPIKIVLANRLLFNATICVVSSGSSMRSFMKIEKCVMKTCHHFAGTPKKTFRDIHVKWQLCIFIFCWVSPLICMRAYKFYNFRDIYFESITYFCPL